jgi:hypothetical protein
MPVACTDFFTFAESIKGDSDEISLRASISRAYYGAFHACQQWHDTKLPHPGHDVGMTGGVHQTLINQLTNPDPGCGRDLGMYSRSLGYALRALRDLRTLADYHLSETVDKEQMKNARAQAKVLIDKASQVPAPLPPASGGSGPAAPIALKRIR